MAQADAEAVRVAWEEDQVAQVEDRAVWEAHMEGIMEDIMAAHTDQGQDQDHQCTDMECGADLDHTMVEVAAVVCCQCLAWLH